MYPFGLYLVNIGHKPNYVNSIFFLSLASVIILLLFYFRFIHKSQHGIKATFHSPKEFTYPSIHCQEFLPLKLCTSKVVQSLC
jgi:hypothetical protein